MRAPGISPARSPCPNPSNGPKNTIATTPARRSPWSRAAAQSQLERNALHQMTGRSVVEIPVLQRRAHHIAQHRLGLGRQFHEEATGAPVADLVGMLDTGTLQNRGMAAALVVAPANAFALAPFEHQ